MISVQRLTYSMNKAEICQDFEQIDLLKVGKAFPIFN